MFEARLSNASASEAEGNADLGEDADSLSKVISHHVMVPAVVCSSVHASR